MKLIKSSYEIIPQENGLEGIYKQIEKAGRTCYYSFDRITETSAKEFVDRMVKLKHWSMLEHGTVYLYLPIDDSDFSKLTEKYTKNKYTVVNKKQFVTTNYHVIIANGWLNDLQYLCGPTEYHEKRITVKFILPISISREFLRHRRASFAELSTRYCNFSREKFGSELTFVKPYWLSADNQERFENWCKQAEDDYMEAINSGLKAQEARELLPLCTKTELVMTAFVSDWEHFFELRCATAAHPQARELADPLYKDFIKNNYIKETE